MIDKKELELLKILNTANKSDTTSRVNKVQVMLDFKREYFITQILQAEKNKSALEEYLIEEINDVGYFDLFAFKEGTEVRFKDMAIGKKYVFEFNISKCDYIPTVTDIYEYKENEYIEIDTL